MERGFPVMHRHRILLPLFLLLSLYAARSLADGPLVLVASAASPIATVTLAEARKLYLGAPLLSEGKAIVPLRNTGDALLQEVFMQRVMHMATATYERQILNRVFRSGGQRPPVYTTVRELVEALDANPLAISYMWKETALATQGIKIIGE